MSQKNRLELSGCTNQYKDHFLHFLIPCFSNLESHASVIGKEGSNEGKLRNKSPHVFCTHNDGEIQMNQKWKFRTDTGS